MSWVRFGDSSLQHLLMGIEDCDKISRNQDWFAKWEEEGRRYKLERCSNNACRALEPDPTVNRIQRRGPYEIICQNTFHINIHIYEYMISLVIHSLI